MRIALLACTLVLGAAVFQDPENKPDSKSGPEIGKPAPSFRLNDHNGKVVEVGGRCANWRVIAFYPKAATPG